MDDDDVAEVSRGSYVTKEKNGKRAKEQKSQKK